MRAIRLETGCTIDIRPAEAANPSQRIVNITGNQQVCPSSSFLICTIFNNRAKLIYTQNFLFKLRNLFNHNYRSKYIFSFLVFIFGCFQIFSYRWLQLPLPVFNDWCRKPNPRPANNLSLLYFSWLMVPLNLFWE